MHLVCCSPRHIGWYMREVIKLIRDSDPERFTELSTRPYGMDLLDVYNHLRGRRQAGSQFIDAVNMLHLCVAQPPMQTILNYFERSWPTKRMRKRILVMQVIPEDTIC